MNSLTKIIATLGPASRTEDQVMALIRAGVNVWRLNLKHETVEIHKQRLDTLIKASAKNLRSPSILIDLQGPQVRLFTQQREPIRLQAGQAIEISQVATETSYVTIPTPELFTQTEVGDTILVDDGQIEFKVTGKDFQKLWWQPSEDGLLKNGKTVTLVGKTLNTPSLTSTDLDYLKALADYPIDFVALSFVRTAQDIAKLREVLSQYHYHAGIVAKIENQAALDNLGSIIDAADAVMVARGDLGVEVAYEDLAFWQKQIIYESRQRTKPVIVATEMLESMVEKNRPSRAEASDVANAVFDGTDATMLSSETAIGRHPALVVQTMQRINTAAEKNALVSAPIRELENGADIMSSMAMGVVERFPHFPIDQFLVFTSSGYTARVLSAYRPKVPIIVITNQSELVKQLNLSYGVNAYFFEFPSGTFTMPNPILHELKEQGIIAVNQKLMIIHGYHWQEPDRANTLSLVEVG